MDKEMLGSLRKIARQKETTMSNIIRSVLEDYIIWNEKEKLSHD